MKIFAIINNYYPISTDSDIDWYQLSDSSILRTGNPFFIPDFASRFEAFPSVVFRIGRLGKSIAPRFASRYIDSATIGIPIIATDLLESLQAEGKPWSRAVSFDRSLILGNFQPIDTFLNCSSFHIRCGENDMTYRLDNLRIPIEEIIAIISADNTMKNGDLILAALPPTGILLQQDSSLSVISELYMPDKNESATQTYIIDTNIR